MDLLRNKDHIDSVQTSTLIRTKALAPTQQPDYLNAVAKIETTFDPDQLLACLLKTEDDLGRTRPQRYAPRTIDLDLLIYEDKIIESKDLIVPHPQMHLRSFVMTGMAELVPDLIHPVIGETMPELLKRLNGGDFVIDPEQPQLISVAGMIGVGKTTLATAISKSLSCPMVSEAYDTNPYIADVYAGRSDLALDSQLYFLNSRIEQITPANLTSGSIVISDYIFEKDKIFASRTLSPEQFTEYKKQYDIAASSITKHVLVIYLKDDPANALTRIHDRNRSYEQKIRIEELQSLADEYDKLFSDFGLCPVITLDAANFNCMDSTHIMKLVKQLGSYVWTS